MNQRWHHTNSMQNVNKFDIKSNMAESRIWRAETACVKYLVYLIKGLQWKCGRTSLLLSFPRGVHRGVPMGQIRESLILDILNKCNYISHAISIVTVSHIEHTGFRDLLLSYWQNWIIFIYTPCSWKSSIANRSLHGGVKPFSTLFLQT